MAENVYLLELELGHRIDGDGWNQLSGDYFYVADTNNDRIKKHVCSDLSYDSKVGSVGAGDDEFDNPFGVCSDRVHFYVTDDSNSRIKKHKCSDLTYALKFGSAGAGDNNFSNPYGICTDNTHTYITDSGNNRIKKHKCSDLTYVAKIGSLGAGNDNFNQPRDICTDGTYLYICDLSNGRVVKRLCADLSYVDEVASTNATGIDTDGTHIYVGRGGDNKVTKYKCSDLSFVADTAYIDRPFGVCTDNTDFYVYSYDDYTVRKYACSDLSYDSLIGSAGSGDDQFDLANYVGYSDEGSGNAYYISHVEGEPSKVEEDGVALTERATLILCRDNAGSWYWDSANTRLYVHTTGSDDPAGYIIIAFFWEYLTNAQYVDEDIIFNGNEYLPYLNDSDIPDVKSETSGYQEGGTRQSFGSVKIINADGRYDTRLTDYIYEAKKIILKAGIKGDAYGGYNTYWIGWTGGIGWSEEEIEIDIEDLRIQHA